MGAKEIKYKNIMAKKHYFVKHLDDIGLSRKYIGYFQVLYILQLIINENKSTKSFSKNIYPLVAKKFDKCEHTIERNIRNLVDKCWNEEVNKKLNINFNENKKPTCCKFINLIKNYIIKQFS